MMITRILAVVATMGAAVGVAHSAPVELVHDIPPLVALEDIQLGSTVATDGQIVAAWERSTDDHIGRVVLYDAVSGGHIGSLMPPSDEPQDAFGLSIAIADGIVAVSVLVEVVEGVETRSVCLFDAQTGALIRKIAPQDDLESIKFGSRIAMSDGLLVVGAPGDQSHFTYVGSVYIFDVATGVQLCRLAPAGGTNNTYGYAVAIDGGRIAIAGEQGVYVHETGSFSLVATLIKDASTWQEGFGASIAMDSGLVAVGAPGQYSWSSPDHGSVYLFDAASGQRLGRVFSVLESPHFFTVVRGFGNRVQLDGGRLYAGTVDDNNAGALRGSIFVFDTSTLTPMGKFYLNDRSTAFGRSFACRDGVIAVGMPHDYTFEDQAGSLLIYNASACSPADIVDPIGVLNLDDLEAFVGAFLASDLLADCDGTGLVNMDDVDCFVAAFLAGCP